MKWSWDLPGPVSLAGHRFVALRYRTKGWRPYSDYAVCLLGKPADKDDPGYTALVPAEDLVSDGRWHTLNLDVPRGWPSDTRRSAPWPSRCRRPSRGRGWRWPA